MPNLQGTHSFTNNNRVFQRKCGLKFVQHILHHIENPEQFPYTKCGWIHTLYVCSKDLQKEIFGRTDGIVQYKLGESLGKGSFGECFAVGTRKGHSLAMKRIPVDDMGHRFKAGEVQVWLHFHKSNPARAVVSPGHDSPCPHLYAVTYDGTYVEMFMDHFRGWTINQLCRQGIELDQNFSQMTVIALLSLSCRCLDVLHQHRILHADISPNNIMVSHDFLHVAIIDFGLSFVLSEGEDFQPAPNYPGSINFMCPQAARNDELDFKADVWAIMMTLFILLADGTPLLEKILPNVTQRSHLRRIIKQFRDDTSNENRRLLWEHIAEFELEGGIMEVVHRCLRCSRAERYTAAEAAEHAGRILQGRQLSQQPEIIAIRDQHLGRPVSGGDEMEVLVVPAPITGPGGDVPHLQGLIPGPGVDVLVVQGPITGPGGDVRAQEPGSPKPSSSAAGGEGVIPAIVEEEQGEAVEGAVGGDPQSKDDDYNDYQDEGLGEDVEDDDEDQEQEEENRQPDF